jgi:hypothetical protein
VAGGLALSHLKKDRPTALDGGWSEAQLFGRGLAGGPNHMARTGRILPYTVLHDIRSIRYLLRPLQSGPNPLDIR